MEFTPISSKEVARFWRKADELNTLDQSLAAFLDRPSGIKNLEWLDLILKGLGISYAAFGERIGMKRQSVRNFCRREGGGDLKLSSLRKFAEAIDCDFVYGFVPRNHESFTEYMMAKALPLVSDPPFGRANARGIQAFAASSRIAKLLASPTGRDQIWGVKKALDRKFSWLDGYGRLR